MWRASSCKNLRTALALVLGLGVLPAAAVGAPTPPAAPPAAPAADMAMGRPDAPVTLVEYGSDTCSHCARFAREVFPDLKKTYIDTGKVRYVFREFPTAPEDLAAAGFLLARCAGGAKYFDVLNALFAAQSTAQTGRDFLLAGAAAGGLDEARMNACVSDPQAIEALSARVALAVEKDKVASTPSFIVNGTPLPPGEKTFADLKTVIDPLIAAHGRKRAP